MYDERLLLLDPRDTVLVVRGRIAAGEAIRLDGAIVTAERDFPLAHKLARQPIKRGDIILKYGAPIGVATDDIAAGAHVHVHNMRSAYTPTYTLDAEKGASA